MRQRKEAAHRGGLCRRYLSGDQRLVIFSTPKVRRLQSRAEAPDFRQAMYSLLAIQPNWLWSFSAASRAMRCLLPMAPAWIEAASDSVPVAFRTTFLVAPLKASISGPALAEVAERPMERPTSAMAIVREMFIV